MIRKYLILLAVVAMLISACAAPSAAPTATLEPTLAPTATLSPTETPAPSATPEPLSFTDGLNNTIILAGPAQRIVSLAASNTEILFAIGAGSQTVGRDTFSDYPEEAKAVADIGGSWGELNLEAITALEPDLILASGLQTPEQVKSLQDVGLTVYLLPNPMDLDGLYANLETVAQLTGRQTEAAALIESLKARVAAVTELVAPLSSAPTVYYELDATDPAAPYTAGPGTFIDALIQLAGGINIAGEMDSPWVQISSEQIVAWNPALIILGNSAYGVTAESVAARAGWDVLDAVKNQQIFPFDDNLVSRPGPRLVDGLEVLVKILHPDLFK
jgi:iron complex transport system substrate-binding protein